MTIDLDKLAASEARAKLDTWEAELSAAAYTTDALAKLAQDAMPPLIAFARERLWAADGDPLADDKLVDLNKLEQLARAATPGPWAHVPVYPNGFTGTAQSGWTVANGYDRLAELDIVREADAAFIAAANPAAVLELLAEIDRLSGQVPQRERELLLEIKRLRVHEAIVRDLAAMDDLAELRDGSDADEFTRLHRRAVEATKP